VAQAFQPVPTGFLGSLTGWKACPTDPLTDFPMAFPGPDARNRAMRRKVLTRILFGTIMAAAMIGLLWLDGHIERGLESPRRSPLYGLPLTLLLLALVVPSFRELSRMAAATGLHLLGVTGLLGAIAVACFPYWWPLAAGQRAQAYGQLPPLALLSFLMLSVLAEQMIRHRIDQAFRRVAGTLMAILYLGIGGALILHLRFRGGVGVLVLFLVAVKCTDVGAYFTGVAFGRHKMIPWLSPGKSWEGLAGGLAAGAGTAVLITWWFGIAGLSYGEAAVFGAVIGLAGQFGDLCESLLKRSAQVKDSGAVLPEFGGVLDIIDSPLLAAPVALVLLAVLT